ncbi:hypothetical protein [Portibacter lacus]|uniref:Uncharacterized protein n=1 Tax=Portibacter lacus TaxID=1099794 RepID=A0AA37SR42_9BACT|nr:hypothetical protein [Portibacter lacus]GLR18467.1 hypothetical protein GCM10007940_30830 [Portibacter lacus]
MMNKKIVLIGVVFLWSLSMFGGTGPSHGIDPKVKKIENTLAHALDIRKEYINAEKAKTYHFESLKFNLENEVVWDEGTEDNLDDIFRSSKEYVKNEKVIKAINAIENLGAEDLIEKLTKSDLVKLPLGIVKTFGGTTYSVVFDQAKIYTTHAKVRVYGRIKNEKVDLCFGAEDIKFSFEGGIVGDATLALFGDFAVPLKSQKVAVVFNKFEGSSNGDYSGTYMTFDCDGFVEAGIDADIALSRDWVLPTDSQGKVIGGGNRVVANIALELSDFNDFVGKISLPYFTLTQDSSVSILVSEATFDYSETKNASGFVHPRTYNFETGTYEDPPPSEEIPLWRGFYINKIEFVLPHVFKTSDEQPLIVGAEKLYIDQKGVSGYIYGDGLIPIETGTIGESEWAFALDHVGVELNYNRILAFDFDGRINIPINKETQRLNYSAFGIPSEEHYNITVGLDSTMSFPLFRAGQVSLTKGSVAFVDVKENKFVPGAILCGGMYVSIGKSEEDDGKVNLDMPGVEFHKLMIRDTLPYVMLDSMGGSITLKIPPILNNSPITIDHLTLTRHGSKNVKLGFGVEVSAMGSKEGGGKTGGAFGILGEYKEVSGKNKWTYAGVEVDAMNIEIVMGTYLWIKGGLEFYQGDSIYGNGFYGYLAGGVLAQDAEGESAIGEHNEYKVRLQANARFGTINPGKDNEYRYWFYDVYVSSSDKLFDIYTPVIAKGIGGGAYHHMRMAGYDMGEMASGSGSNPYSGITYRPNAGTLFGIKFTLGIGITGVDGFKGNVTLELAIDTSLALQNIMLYGNGEFASDKFKLDALSRLDDLSLSQEESTKQDSIGASTNNHNKITAAIMIYMDFENGFELQGNFAAFLDAADGVISGQAAVDMYISAEEQHLYIGGYEGLVDIEGMPIPESYVYIGFGGFNVHAKFYLCTGTKLPPPPKIPTRIANMLGISTGLNNRTLLANNSQPLAAGFALGASIALDVNISKTFIKFDLNALAGYDISLLSNPSSTYCSNASGLEQGINGWRAKGQIYGDLYTKLELWAFGWWTVWNRQVAFAVMADLPKPTHLFIKGKYLNKKGNKKKEFEHEMGNKCGQIVYN